MGAVIPPSAESALALATIVLEDDETHTVESESDDALLYVFGGGGELALGGETYELDAGTGILVLASESAVLAGRGGLELLCTTVGPEADRHAPLGPRAVVARLTVAGSEEATGARSFQILFGPHNGSARATLFAGFIPPGRAPWHYHLYDEIVWVPEGPGRLHVGDSSAELGRGSAFRLRPRQVHIVENLGSREMTVIGIFTPAGSPSAAYLTPDAAAEYRFAG